MKLSKIGDALRQPGPYEAPARSADYDEDAPHWVVLHLGGRIVEQSAFSFSLSGDGGGAELAEVKRRLDELGEAAEVRGVVLRFADLDVSYPDAGELADSISRMRTRGSSNCLTAPRPRQRPPGCGIFSCRTLTPARACRSSTTPISPRNSVKALWPRSR